MGNRKLHIVLDLQACQSPESGRRGIGRYSLALAKAMVANPRGHRISLLLNAAMSESIEFLRGQFDSLVPQDDIVVWQGLDPAAFLSPGSGFRRRASEALRLDALRSLRPDVVHVASLFDGLGDNVTASVSRWEPYVAAVTLYDLIPLAHQDVYLANPDIRAWYMEKIQHLLQAHQLLGISRFSCEEAKQALSIPEERLTNISGAADSIFVRLNNAESFRTELMARYGLAKPFVMYAGGFDARKNIGALVRAFAGLPAVLRQDHQLAIIGGVPEPERAALDRIIAESGSAKEDVIFTGYVPDADLVKLYNLCALYVFPSLQEGFGLPALEAMSSGAVVIGSGTSSLPEVIGMEEALFDPRNGDSIREKIAFGLSDEGFRQRFLEHGKLQARKFSWADSARYALEGMEAACEREAVGRVEATAPVLPSGKRVALLAAPASTLPARMRGARVYADKDCDGVADKHPLARFAKDRHRFDRVVIEVADHPYCAKALMVAAAQAADLVVRDAAPGRALAALAKTDNALLVELLYRAGGYVALDKAIRSGFDAGVLGELVPAAMLDLLGQSQVVAMEGGDAGADVAPKRWRDHADEFVSSLLDGDVATLADSWDWAAVSASLAANANCHDQPERWFVDISNLVVHDAGTGVQRVVRHMLDEMMNTPPSGYRIEPVYMDDQGVFRHARSYCSKRYFEGLRLPVDEAVEMRRGDVFLGLDLAAHLVPQHLPAFRRLRDLGVRLYFVVYDLLPLLRPDCFDPPGLPLFRAWYEAVAQVSDGVLCISRAVADEFESWLHQSRPDRHRPLGIGWFHLGADLAVATTTDPAASAHDANLDALGERPTFLMVGTIEPRKGHAQALSAFEKLWKQGVEANLLIIGKPGWLVDGLIERLRGHPQRGKRLFWFEKAGDDLLLASYRRASALLMPSEGEGFGLPLIEAAHHGVPLIVRDLPVFREIANEHAHYFHGYDPEELSKAIASWLDLDARGMAPSSAGMHWMTWSEATTQLVDAVMGRHWTHRWVASDVRRFGAFDYRFQTQVGRLRRGRMETTGRAGILVYGPYVPIPAGRYVVEVCGDGTGRGWIDVCSTRGAQVHAFLNFALAASAETVDDGLVHMGLVLDRDVDDLEIRMGVEEGADVRIDWIQIRPDCGTGSGSVAEAA